MGNAASLEEFDIRVKRIRMQNQETASAVFEAVVLIWRPIRKEWAETKQKITCVGHFYGLVENDHLHVHAEEVENPIYGQQWQIYLSERVQPGTEVELVRFLTSIKGVGPKHAERLIQAFGMDVISKVSDDCSLLNGLPLPKTAKENLYQAIVENRFFEELLLFIQLHGIPPKHAACIYRKYGVDAIEKIRDNPYALYLDDVIDFPAADMLSLKLTGNYRPHRVSAGLLACLRADSEKQGNVFVSQSCLRPMLEQFLNQTLPGDDIALSDHEVSEALMALVSSNTVIVEGAVDKEPAVYLALNYYAERRVAARLYELSTSPKSFFAYGNDIDAAMMAVSVHPLAPEQASAVKMGLTSSISILTGGPGTGKTQTLTTLINTARRLKPDADIRICAPTGKAAVRAQELTGLHASTIHKLVGYPHDLLEEDELVCDILIADEYSMCDIQLCAWLFKCVCTGARVLIVGDHEQLPSVGPGLVLRDMINSGVIPVTRLTKVFRQAGSSRITQNAHAIIETPVGQPVEMAYSTTAGSDFYFIEAQTQSKILLLIKKSVKRLLEEGFPADQIEVLSPIHGGLIGTGNLNLVLQDLLRPGPTGYMLASGNDLRLGDKVIQTKNDYDISVFNGETGMVKQIDYSPTRAVQISFPNRDVWYDSEQVEALELAYAITTHRSQGSEFKAVVIPVHETILFNMNRNLLYTAMTRAKERVVFVGSRAALDAALKKDGAMRRMSNLIPRLQAHFAAASIR